MVSLLLPLMIQKSLLIFIEPDNTGNSDNDNLNLPSTYRARRNSRGCRDRPSPRYGNYCNNFMLLVLHYCFIVQLQVGANR